MDPRCQRTTERREGGHYDNRSRKILNFDQVSGRCTSRICAGMDYITIVYVGTASSEISIDAIHTWWDPVELMGGKTFDIQVKTNARSSAKR